MALPVTITGIALDVATVGPYRSSGGNYYFFGKDASTATTLQCFKATDPTVAWSSVATNAGFAGDGIFDISGYVDGDIVHLVVADGTEYVTSNYKYRTFNMATEAFVIAETAAGSISTVSLHPFSSIVVRSDGSPVVIFESTTGGLSLASVSYTLRTGTNTWSGPAQVDDAGGYYPVAALGASDEVHFVYTKSPQVYQKALTSGNVLQSATTKADNFVYSEAVTIDFNGSKRCLAAGLFYANVLYFDSGDSPVLYTSSLGSGINTATIRIFVRNNVVYVIYNKTISGNLDYYFTSSTDGGAHWEPEVFICHTNNNGSLTGTSRFARLFTSLYDIIMPFIYVDSAETELKYNHKPVGTIMLEGLATFSGGSSFNQVAIGGDFSAPLEDPFRLRFSIVNEGETLDAAAWQLYVSKNGGAYHAVTTTSDDAYSLNAGSSPDETPIFIPRLTIPA